MGLKDGLVFDASLDEGQGTVSYDKSGEGLNGTIAVGGGGIGAFWANTRYGKPIATFDGIADSVVYGKPATPVSSFSISCWVYNEVADADLHAIVAKCNGSGQAGYYMAVYQNDIRLTWNDGAGISGYTQTADNLPTNEWIHIIGTYNTVTGIGYIYFNGVKQVSSGTTTASFVDLDGYNISVGARANGTEEFLPGRSYKEKIWNRALSDHEARKLYEIESDRGQFLQDSIALDLDFVEGAGGVAYDKSQYQNNGALLPLSPTWIASGGITLDGINDNVLVDDSTSLDITNVITIAIDFKHANTDTEIIFSKNYAGAYEVGIVDDVMKCYIGGATDDSTVGIKNIGTDRHVVVWTYNDTTKKSILMIDGIVDRDDTLFSEMGTNNIGIQIGGRWTGGALSLLYTGDIYRFRIYNAELTRREAKQLTEKWMNTTINDNIVVDYKYNEGVGAVLYDNGPNSLHGTIVDSPTWQSGGGILFAINDDVIVPHNAALNITGHLTIAVAIKMDNDNLPTGAPNARLIIGKGANWTGEPYMLYYQVPTDNLTFSLWDTETRAIESIDFSANHDDELCIVVCVWDGTALTIYINGEVDAQELSSIPTAALTTNADNLGIAGNATRYMEHIYMYRSRLYDRGLTPTQVKQLTEKWLEELN